MRGFIPVAVAWLLALPQVVGAQVPPVVGFDGVLFTAEQCCGYSYEGAVTFRLCDSAGGACTLGGSAWEETHDPATVDGGYLHADLGAVVPLPATAFAGQRWLEVALDEGIGTLSPRIRLTSVPYAWQCLDAATVGGQAPDAFAPVSHEHPWSSVTGVPAALADGQVAWEEVTGKPATFEPSGHLHAIADVTGLQTALDGKSTTGHNHDGKNSAALANSVVGAGQLAANAVTSDKIQDGTIGASDVDANSIQKRVAGTCPANSSIRAIASNGTVTCESASQKTFALATSACRKVVGCVNNMKECSVNCGGSERAVGGGVFCSSTEGWKTFVTLSQPLDNLAGWSGKCLAFDGTENGLVSVSVVCCAAL